MDINFACPNCRQSLEIDESGAGITIDCPKCGKPVYVPSRSPAPTLFVPPPQPPSAIRVAVRPTARPASMLPSIEGGIHCVAIAAGLLIVAFVLFRTGLVLAMVFNILAIPFQMGALLCAVYGICKGSIKRGLALLAGVGLLFTFS